MGYSRPFAYFILQLGGLDDSHEKAALRARLDVVLKFLRIQQWLPGAAPEFQPPLRSQK